MKRILHIFQRMDRGGAETLIMNVYRNLDRSLVQFDFAVHSNQPGHYDAEIEGLGGRILHIPAPSIRNLHVYNEALSYTLKSFGPFAGVHSHVHYFSGQVLRIAGKANILVRLAHSHNTEDGKKSTLLRKVYRYYMRWLINRHATHLLGCSHVASEALFGSKYLQDRRASVLPNAIDIKAFEALSTDKCFSKERQSLLEDKIVIGHVGRFSKQKNHSLLLRIFGQLLEKLPNTRLVLVGAGELRVEIEQLIQSMGITNSVTILGIRDDVPEIMGDLDLFLLPSLYEGLGIVIIEAQAAGVPCILSDTVPREADLNMGLVKYINLEADIDVWTEAIIAQLGVNIPSWDERKEILHTAGYDIRDTSSRLQEIYLRG